MSRSRRPIPSAPPRPPPVRPASRPASTPAPVASPAGSRLYLKLRVRILLTFVVGLGWLGISTWISLPWARDLSEHITPVGAWLVILGIALIPGYLNIQLLAGVLLDRPLPRRPSSYPDLTVIVAAYREEARIDTTLRHLTASRYPGGVEFMVVDDGSDDRTAELALAWAGRDDRVRVVRAPHGGKSHALNVGLATVRTPLVATIDADTLLTPHALERAVSRLLAMPPDAVAVAGAVMVRNSRDGWLTRVQQWDYLIGIAAVKREQALLQGTLVAQGAFSVYRADALRAAGGWPDAIGEDIVLTWAMLRDGGRVGFEPTAVAFTEAPVTFRHFVRQRQRWARGMVEGLRTHGVALVRRRRAWAHGVVVDMTLPFLDAAYAIAVPVGIVLACTGRLWIIGPMTLIVLPINLAIAFAMLARERRAFAEVGLRVRRSPRDLLGLVAFVLVYQLVMSPVSLSGYVAELLRTRRSW